MKHHTFPSIAAACAVAVASLPLMAADQPSGTTIKSRDNRNMSSQSATKSEASSDRRIDFGKPVRFVRNTFSRDNDQSNDAGMNRDRSDDNRAQWRGNQRDEHRMSNQGRNEDRDQNRFWNRGEDRRSEMDSKKDNPGFFSRILNWRPFGDRNQ